MSSSWKALSKKAQTHGFDLFKKLYMITPYSAQYSTWIFYFCGGKGVYDHLMSTRIFTLMMNKIVIQAPKFMRKAARTSS